MAESIPEAEITEDNEPTKFLIPGTPKLEEIEEEILRNDSPIRTGPKIEPPIIEEDNNIWLMICLLVRLKENQICN